MTNLWYLKDQSGAIIGQSKEEHIYNVDPKTQEIKFDKIYQKWNNKGELICSTSRTDQGLDRENWTDLLKINDII